MQISLIEQFDKSNKSKDDLTREFDTGIGSDDQKNHDPIYFDSQNSHPNPINFTHESQNDFKENRTQTSTIEQSTPHRSATLANKKQYIESIRLSYLILSKSIETSPEKKKKKPLKKSFVVISEEEDNDMPDEKIKESLRTPLKIDLKKLEQNNKFTELSEGLQMLNGKNWEKCHMDVNLQAQQLVISNLHIPFTTISKIKIYKQSQSGKLREIKVTYEKGSEEGLLNLGISGDKHVKKIPGDYGVFQQILVQKLGFQNRFKQTKWQKKGHICEQIMFESYIFGQIYKKSQFLGKWQKRYIVLNEKGIFSYKSLIKKQQHTFFISKQSLEYMWSRFDIIDGHLIIKVKHGLKKTQFGIPIANYSYPHYKNWLYCFYKLMAS